MITLTEAARTYVKKIIAKKGGGAFHIHVKTTGCSGLSYLVTLVDTPGVDDLQFIQSDGMVVYTNQQSYPFIKGLIIDFAYEGLSGKYQFLNPNEKGSCGCGESFTV